MPTTTDTPRRAVECTTEHTRILRVMLASSDCAAYWRLPDVTGSVAERAKTAFLEHWFGTKSEARVRTLMGDMALRFDAYPSAFRALRAWRPAASLAPWLCHTHLQLADPIYRRFTGDYLPGRIEFGYVSVDRDAVARWVSETWPGRWSPATCLKFGSNLLATAHEAGLIESRKDPRPLSAPRPPKLAFEYMFYLLRDVEISGGLLERVGNSSRPKTLAPVLKPGVRRPKGLRRDEPRPK